jgi:hypothetical protein
MRFRLYREYGALNSGPLFDAFSSGLRKLGHTETSTNEDVSVIWSVLWRGRMKPNEKIYQTAVKNNKPVIIIEVGNLKRGQTWRVSLGNVNFRGEFGNDVDLDLDRSKKLGVNLQNFTGNRRSEILLCGQLSDSLQWQNMPTMESWVANNVAAIREYTDRKIVFRPHPRQAIRSNFAGMSVEIPKKIPNSYDDYAINYNYHCVINHNSGPTVQAAIAGTPVVCDSSGLAWPVSSTIQNIEAPVLPDREDWFLKLCHTEWTVDEIQKGLPLARLLPKISL